MNEGKSCPPKKRAAASMTKNRTGKSATQTHTHGGSPLLAVFGKGGVLVFVLESMEFVVSALADSKSRKDPQPCKKCKDAAPALSTPQPTSSHLNGFMPSDKVLVRKPTLVPPFEYNFDK
jgi:hypothetical protein